LNLVHIMTRKRLMEFAPTHPDARALLNAWFTIVWKTDYASFANLRVAFPSADQVGQFTVFNIGNNNFRLIAAIHDNRKKMYIRRVLTHAEYDRGAWRICFMLAKYIHDVNADYRRIRQ
jgi:mRNA interferase HigB